MFGVNFVSFDDTRSCADRQADIEAFVKSEFSKGYPVVLMVHLPLLTDELCSDFVEGKGCMAGRKKVDPRHLSGYGYGNKRHERAFVDWILAQKNLKTVLCGHLHHEAHCRLSETVVQHVAGAAMNGLACEITFN